VSLILLTVISPAAATAQGAAPPQAKASEIAPYLKPLLVVPIAVGRVFAQQSSIVRGHGGPHKMLDAFLEHPFFLNRHRQAPLLKERESFLSHLQQQGTSRKAPRNLSAEPLQVVRLLNLTEMRDVSLEEIQRAPRCWCSGRPQRLNATQRV
jgi:hypothetical protein